MAGLSVDWEQDGQRAIIRQGGALLNTARLIGVPFLLVGAYFGRFFFEGLFDGGLTIAGWIALPLLMVGAGLPGWCFLVWRRHATLDTAKKEVAEELDFIIFKRRWAAPFTVKSAIRLRFERGSKDSNRYSIHVDVITPDRNDTMIGLFDQDQEAEALALATRAGAFLGLPVKNKLVERGSVTSGGVVADENDPEFAGEFENDDDKETEDDAK